MEAPEIVAAIAGGGLDGDLTDVLDAVRARQEAGAVETLWRIDFQGLIVDASNLTVGEARVVESALKVSVNRLTPAASVLNIATIVAAALMGRNGMTSTEAFAEVDRCSSRDLLKSVSVYTETNPPKDGSGSQTSGPSPATI